MPVILETPLANARYTACVVYAWVSALTLVIQVDVGSPVSNSICSGASDFEHKVNGSVYFYTTALVDAM